MLFSTTTNSTSEIGTVVTETFSDFGIYIVFILGIVLAFFFAEVLLSSIFPNRYTKKIDNQL